jgi:hypothetical protein
MCLPIAGLRLKEYCSKDKCKCLLHPASISGEIIGPNTSSHKILGKPFPEIKTTTTTT